MKFLSPFHLRRFARLSIALLLLVSAWSLSAAQACDTPVYRYAMYRWQPAPFEIYFFHKGEINDHDAQVHRAINEAADDIKAPANIVLLPVDLNEDAELIGVPPDVKKSWLSKKDRAVPGYLVVSPLGMLLYDGPLDEQDIAEMTHSPARTKIAKALENGAASVLVLLGGKDSKATLEAKKQIQTLAADVSNGKISLYSGPADQFAESENKKVESPQQHISIVELSSSDPKEVWLIRSLKAVESDLGEFVNEPMVFAVYGRGRALPPYIGKGITRDNLIECVQFVTGACSCTVKEQNPGADLLVAYDWELAAEKLMNIFGSEEGNEKQFGAADLFPDLIIPTKLNEQKESDSKNSDANETVEKQETEPAEVASTEVSDPENSQRNKPANDAEQASLPQSRPETLSIETPSSGATLSVWVVGGGLAVAVVLLFFTTLLILKPR